MLEFNYSITDEDYLRFNTHQVLSIDAGKKDLNTYRRRLIFTSLCLFLIVVLISNDLVLTIFESVFLGILLLIMLLLSKQNYLRAIRRHLNKLKKENLPLPYTPEYNLSFGDDSFTNTSKGIATTFNYSVVDTVWVTPTDIYIYVNSISAIIIPFTAFSSVDEINSLIGFLSTKVDHSKFKSAK